MSFSCHYYSRQRGVEVLGAGCQVGGGPGQQRQAGQVHDGRTAFLTQLGGLSGVVVAEHVGAAQQEDAACVGMNTKW